MAARLFRARFYYFLCAAVLIMTVILLVSQQIEVHAIIVDQGRSRSFIGGINPCPSCDELAGIRLKTKQKHPILETVIRFRVIPSSPTIAPAEILVNSVVNYFSSVTVSVSSGTKSENFPVYSASESKISDSTVDSSLSNTTPSLTVTPTFTEINMTGTINRSVTLETKLVSVTPTMSSIVKRGMAPWPRNYRGNSPARDLREKIYRYISQVSPPIFNITNRIPQIIHQTWISTSIPAPTKPWIEKWKETNPDWTYMFWTDKSARDFIVKYYKPLLEIYDSYALPVQKADMFRYIVLFAFGGVYADLDIEPLKSLNPIRDWSPCILSREPEAHHQVASWILFGSRKELNYTLACNAFMACRPGHPYLFFLISRLVERSPNVSKKPCPLGTTLWCTGPYILTETAFFYKSALGDLVVTYPKDDVFIASSVDFMPTFSSKQVNEMKKHCNKLDKMPKLGVEICKILQKRNFTNFEPNINESHTVHHWFGSYHQNKGQLNEKIYVNDLMPKAMNFSQMEPYFNITYPSAETTPILNDWPTTHEWPIRHWGDSPAQELRMKIYETMHEVSPTVFNMSRKIPQIIHQTWISSSIPVVTKPWIAKWKDTNPDWTYMFWTDKSARDFIVKYYRPLLEIYDSYTVPVQKADMFRYIVLFAFGGVYADLDIEPLKSLNPIRDWSPCILSREPEAHHQVANWIYYGSKVELNYTLASNAFMACRPGHPYLFYLISYLAKQSPKVSEKECAFYRTIWCTGPVVVTQSAAFYKRALLNLTDTYPNDDIFIAKSVDFLPTFDPSQVEQMKTNCNRPDKMPQLGVETCKILQQRNFSNFETDDMKSYTVHHYLGSFYKKKEELHLDQTINVKDIVPNVTQLHELEPYFNKTNL